MKTDNYVYIQHVYSSLTEQIQWDHIGLVEVNIHANINRMLSDTYLIICKILEDQLMFDVI